MYFWAMQHIAYIIPILDYSIMYTMIHNKVGSKHGKLTVLSVDDEGIATCRCDCGTDGVKQKRLGVRSSCGCRFSEQAQNMVGKRYGKWMVMCLHSKTKSGQAKLLCRCDCGIENAVWSTHLVSGQSKSCGCQKRHGKEHKMWTGHGGISGQLWGQIKNSASGNKGTRAKLELSITIEDVWKLYQRQGGKCALSGVELSLPLRYNRPGTASLDRVDNSMGYVAGNVQWVHKYINFMKGTLDQDFFISLCKDVARVNA